MRKRIDKDRRNIAPHGGWETADRLEEIWEHKWRYLLRMTALVLFVIGSATGLSVLIICFFDLLRPLFRFPGWGDQPPP